MDLPHNLNGTSLYKLNYICTTRTLFIMMGFNLLISDCYLLLMQNVCLETINLYHFYVELKHNQ